MYSCVTDDNMEQNRRRCRDVQGWRWQQINIRLLHIVNIIAHNVGGGGGITVHKVDCLGEETFLVPGCPGIWGSVAPARWQKFKKGMTSM